MLTALLVRHASCDHVGQRIAGRLPGVQLNALGTTQAEALAEVIAGLGIAAIYSGPLERARQTAGILAARTGHQVRLAPGLDELDFGTWTGRSLASLDSDPVWQAFNQARDTTRIPGGELMSEAVDRARAELARMEDAHPDATVVAVSHGDVIRGLLVRCLGLPMGAVHRLEASPASVSVIRLWPGSSQVVAVNWVAGVPPR